MLDEKPSIKPTPAQVRASSNYSYLILMKTHVNTHPSGCVLGTYDPTTEYCFVSYRTIASPKWVRMPFLTIGQMKDALDELPLLLTEQESPLTGIQGIRFIQDFTDLKIYSESWLSELHRDWDQVSERWVDSEYTNRQIIFGNTYEQLAVRFTGISSLSRQNGEDVDGWRDRVAQQRSAQKESQSERYEMVFQIAQSQHEIRSRSVTPASGTCA